tara:strand:- start:1591 stop:2136 length:546 start_codon:yes stop_codon:yes gene_type:complete
MNHDIGEQLIPDSIYQQILSRISDRINESNIMVQSFDDQKVKDKPTLKEYIDKIPCEKVTKEMVEQEEYCSICLDKFSEGVLSYILPCNHYFHDGSSCDCGGLLPWLEKNNTCPVCRLVLPEEPEKEEEQEDQGEQEPGRGDQMNGIIQIHITPMINLQYLGDLMDDEIDDMNEAIRRSLE